MHSKILSFTLFQLFLLLSAMLSGCSGITDKKDDQDVFYPPLPNPPRIQHLTSYSGPNDLVAGDSSFSRFILGEESNDAALIKKPYGVAINDGVLYVVDLRGP
ncbi:MAG: hypothetical protein KAT90_11190, partial [Gammaproteobacteria bacterium]|nr:hypothetical protein [Gammaproteobacteria bacterium]